MDLAAVRAGAVTVLDTIDGLTGYANGYTSVRPPAAIVMLDEADYWTSMDGTAGRLQRLDIALVVLVDRTNERGALELLDLYASSEGAKSIPAAFLADPTLGGEVDHATVRRLVQIGEVRDANQTYLGAEFLLEIHGR
ncbi:MAG: hypothetical protein GY925_22745 [Actinomycetia bacterium]|nr:hypothetical protein [Actinomycetes bacterium]